MKINYTKMTGTLRSKSSILSLALIYVFIMVVGSTFSWLSAGDALLNPFETGRHATRISEIFKGAEELYPSQEVQKVVQVRNTGTSAALVRVSLSAYLTGFEHDLGRGGSGGIKVYDTPATALDRRFPATWMTGQSRQIGPGAYHYAHAPATASRFGLDVANRTDDLRYFGIVFDVHVYNATTISSKASTIDEYWYFENGWFYYSKALVGENTLTKPLISAVRMNEVVPYSVQGNLFALMVEHQSLVPVADALVEWQAGSDGMSGTGTAHDILMAAIAAVG